MLKALWKDEEGLEIVEYALLLALVAIVAITAWSMVHHPAKTITPGS